MVMTTTTTPTPLPPGSRRLRDRRYETTVHGPKNERGAYPALGPEARFTPAGQGK